LVLVGWFAFEECMLNSKLEMSFLLSFQLFAGFVCGYTVQVKSLETLLFLMFLKEVSSAHQACIYLIKNTEKTVIL